MEQNFLYVCFISIYWMLAILCELAAVMEIVNTRRVKEDVNGETKGLRYFEGRHLGMIFKLILAGLLLAVIGFAAYLLYIGAVGCKACLWICGVSMFGLLSEVFVKSEEAGALFAELLSLKTITNEYENH